MKKTMLGFVSGLGMLAIVGAADATSLIQNGDFQTGDLSGWEKQGTVKVVQGGLLGLQGMTDYYAQLGGYDTGGNQKLYQDFSVKDISSITVSFDWAFDSIDFSKSADDTFLAIAKENDSKEHKIKMLDLKSSNLNTSYFFLDAAWGHYSQTFSIADWILPADRGEIIFKLKENLSWCTDSIVGIDNVVIEASPAPVPEPTTILFAGVGLAGIFASRIRRKVRKVS